MRVLGERLRMVREKLGFSQGDVMAKVGGATRQALSLWELGHREPPMETLTQLARLYGVSVDWLLGLTDSPLPRNSRITAHEYRIPLVARVAAGRPLTEAWEGEVVVVGDFAGRSLLGLRLTRAAAEELPAGSIAIVELVEDVPDGSLALVLWPDVEEAQIRRLYRINSVALLVSDVGEPAVTVSLADLRIIGRVIGAQMLFDSTVAATVEQ